MNIGKFIVFEGINGAGKTTIINKIYQDLNQKNIKSKIIKFPNRNTKSGQIIDKFLKNQYQFASLSEQIKIFADNRTECKDEIITLLQNNYIILCDRYVYSNIAYILTDQTFNIINNINKNNIITCSDIIKYDINLIKPNYVFLINGDYIHLRNNEITERYHSNINKNYVIFNNYLHSFNYTNTNFTIINNKIDNIYENINVIIDIIMHLNTDKLIHF